MKCVSHVSQQLSFVTVFILRTTEWVIKCNANIYFNKHSNFLHTTAFGHTTPGYLTTQIPSTYAYYLHYISDKYHTHTDGNEYIKRPVNQPPMYIRFTRRD
jgi:hypothetical protein